MLRHRFGFGLIAGRFLTPPAVTRTGSFFANRACGHGPGRSRHRARAGAAG
jgi:hypothetical protein